MLKTIADTMLAQLHPNPPWSKLTQARNPGEDETRLFDESDQKQLIHARSVARDLAQAQSIPDSKAHNYNASFAYEPLNMNISLGWKQPVFPWHNPERNAYHFQPMTNTDMFQYTMLTSPTQSGYGHKQTDEKRSVYDYLIDKDTDVTYLTMSESIHRPHTRSKSSSLPCTGIDKPVVEDQCGFGDGAATTTVPAIKPPVSKSLTTTKMPFATRPSPQRWVEFNDQTSPKILECTSANALTDFGPASNPHASSIQPECNDCLIRMDSTRVLPNSCDKENLHQLNVSPQSSGVAPVPIPRTTTLLQQWNEICEPRNLPVKDPLKNVQHTRPKRNPEPKEKFCLAHAHQSHTSVSHAQRWTFTFYNFEDQNDVQDTDALMNSVFAVLVTQLKHGSLSYRNACTTLQNQQPQQHHHSVLHQKNPTCESPSHRHITICNPNATCTVNSADHSNSAAFNLCVRWWATGTGKRKQNRPGQRDNPLKKTYICATLSGPCSTDLLASKPCRRHRRRRTPKTISKTADQLERCCPCGCQTDTGWNCGTRINPTPILSTITLNDDESVACHTSSSSFKLSDRTLNQCLVSPFHTCEWDPHQRRRRHSHCDTQRLSESCNWFKRRQVVSSYLQGTSQIEQLNDADFLDRTYMTHARLQHGGDYPVLGYCLHHSTGYDKENTGNICLCDSGLVTRCQRDRRRRPIRRSGNHIRTHSQPQTAQEKQRSIPNPQQIIDAKGMQWRCGRPCRYSVKQRSPFELVQDQNAKSHDRVKANPSENQYPPLAASPFVRDEANERRLNEFVSRQKQLIADRKTRHRYRKSLGQQLVKEWLGVALTLG